MPAQPGASRSDRRQPPDARAASTRAYDTRATGPRAVERRPAGPRAAGAQPTETWAAEQGATGSRATRALPAGTQATGPRAAMARPGGRRGGTARTTGPRDSRGRRSARPARGLGQWSAMQGGLAVCIVVASAAVGAIATMVARSEPGFLLGLMVVAGTAAAALVVRPREGWMILPVPVLSYLVAALLSGVVVDRAADSSRTQLAVAAAQWAAGGFFAMVLATVLAAAIISARWYLWRRARPAPRGQGRAAPQADPGRKAPVRARAARPEAGPGREPRPAWETSAEPGYPAGYADPDPLGPAGDAGTRPIGPRGPRPGPPSRRPGPGPYNFSSGA